MYEQIVEAFNSLSQDGQFFAILVTAVVLAFIILVLVIKARRKWMQWKRREERKEASKKMKDKRERALGEDPLEGDK